MTLFRVLAIAVVVSILSPSAFAADRLTVMLDWFINPDTARIEAILEKLTSHYKAAHMQGFSMGGYGAFRFARATNATYVTAISPQF